MPPYRLYIFDLDGTLYRGSKAVPHSLGCLDRLRKQGALIRFVTNNSAAQHCDVAQKLKNMGFAASPEEVLSSGQLACAMAVANGYNRVMLMGEPPFHSMAQSVGLRLVNRQPDLVLAGICRKADYAMVEDLSNQVRLGIPFWVTNLDRTFPLERGRLQPGAGAMIAAICAAAGRQPDRIIGKPSANLIEAALASAGCMASEALVVGDRLDTDMAAGINAGCDTWLVLTGVESELPAGQNGSPDLRGLLNWNP